SCAGAAVTWLSGCGVTTTSAAGCVARTTWYTSAAPPSATSVEPPGSTTTTAATSLSSIVAVTGATAMPLYLGSALATVCVTVPVCVPCCTASSTARTVTVCGTLQLPGPNVSVWRSVVTAESGLTVTRTSAVGPLRSATVYVSLAPPSATCVARPDSVTSTPGESLSVTCTGKVTARSA